MKKKKEETVEEVQVYETTQEKLKTVRNHKGQRKRKKTTISINNSIQGDSLEVMIERLREGEGEEGIQDRDLVYNDNEASRVNPVTNIRSDKMELMLEEKIGEYEHRSRKNQKINQDVDKAVEEEVKNMDTQEAKTE